MAAQLLSKSRLVTSRPAVQHRSSVYAHGREPAAAAAVLTRRSRRQLSCNAAGQQPDKTSTQPQPTITDSDLAFVGKLVALSFAGATVIKYGSLLISLPFEPSAAVATAVVLGTPALYSLFLLTQSQSSKQ